MEASTWDDDDKNPIDLTEAYLEYRPYPRAGWRTRVRLGAFYPPMSLESRAIGWETPYTITPSAISSWIGEEIRTIGLEAQVDWLGTRLGHSFDFQLTGAVFGWNDPAGTMLAMHGFAMHDRQTTLFGRVGALQTDLEMAKKELFHEIDGRPGFYVGAQARYLDRAILNVLHYDNRADPAAEAVEIRDFAWKTRFDAAALRIETANELDRTGAGHAGRYGDQSVHVAHLGIRFTVRARRKTLGTPHAGRALRLVRNRIRG